MRQGIIFPSDFGPNDSFVSWIFQSFIISDEDDMRKKINGKADTDWRGKQFNPGNVVKVVAWVDIMMAVIASVRESHTTVCLFLDESEEHDSDQQVLVGHRVPQVPHSWTEDTIPSVTSFQQQGNDT